MSYVWLEHHLSFERLNQTDKCMSAGVCPETGIVLPSGCVCSEIKPVCQGAVHHSDNEPSASNPLWPLLYLRTHGAAKRLQPSPTRFVSSQEPRVFWRGRDLNEISSGTEAWWLVCGGGGRTSVLLSKYWEQVAIRQLLALTLTSCQPVFCPAGLQVAGQCCRTSSSVSEVPRQWNCGCYYVLHAVCMNVGHTPL